MNRKEIEEFIANFATLYKWSENNVPEQLRAFFTTWAFLFRIEADTSVCDNFLLEIYSHIKGEKPSYNDFEWYMLDYIV